MWTADEHNAMRVLFQTGLTATAAAAEFSRQQHSTITRNAMCGAWHRMGLRRGDKRGNDKQREKREANIGRSMTQRIKRNSASSVAQRIQKAAQWRAAHTAAFEESEPADIRKDDLDVRTRHACDLLSLTNSSCRWPVGDVGRPDFFFCGVPEAAFDQSRPYCRGHSRRARGCR